MTYSTERIIVTPSAYAKEHYFYVQEVGSLTCIEPHISSRQNLNSYLFLIVTAGSGTLTYNKSVYSLCTGDCAWIDCHLPYSHESSSDNPWALSWIHFNGISVSHFYHDFMEKKKLFIFHPAYASSFTDIISLIYETQKKQSHQTELLSNKYITDIITLCFTENEHTFSGNQPMPEKIEQIRQYIESHFNQKITLDSLAEQFYISKYYLAREYKKKLGMTIGNYILSKRISHAKSLLRYSTDSISQISKLCGFGEVGYFIKTFKNFENMTPFKYRKKW